MLERKFKPWNVPEVIHTGQKTYICQVFRQNKKVLCNDITCVMIFSCNKPHVRYVSWSPRKQKIKRIASCIVLWVCCKAWDNWGVACWRPSPLIKGSGPARQSLIALGKHPGPENLSHLHVYGFPGRKTEALVINL